MESELMELHLESLILKLVKSLNPLEKTSTMTSLCMSLQPSCLYKEK